MEDDVDECWSLMWWNCSLFAGSSEDCISEDSGHGETHKSQGFPKYNQAVKMLNLTFGKN